MNNNQGCVIFGAGKFIEAENRGERWDFSDEFPFIFGEEYEVDLVEVGDKSEDDL